MRVLAESPVGLIDLFVAREHLLLALSLRILALLAQLRTVLCACQAHWREERERKQERTKYCSHFDLPDE
jgi:hypothetical protein